MRYFDENGHKRKEVNDQNEGDSISGNDTGGGSSLYSEPNYGGNPTGKLSLQTRFNSWWNKLFKGTSETKLLADPKMHFHHIFPQSMKDWFAKRGIDVDKYTVELTQGTHLRGIHGKGGFAGPEGTVLGGKFNNAWKTFMKNNPNATAKDIFQYAGQLMDEYGLSGLEIVPYE